jgi:redox-sensitive bicupin YhaK (pirin superfamily)
MTKGPNVIRTFPLTMPWQTSDPFLFCAYHRDEYPAGDARMAPVAALSGRNIGSDFSGKDGWSMYHGESVPGFPAHPHRGFETITIVRSGFVDHADSLGAAARFGNGDVQWVTAGAGIVHSEMFPLVHEDAPNPTELFQIWLNLPPEDKMAEPHFTMYWAHEIPVVAIEDDAGRAARVRVIAGEFGGVEPRPAPPRSWASRADSHVAVWTVELDPSVHWTLPAGAAELSRAVYVIDGDGVVVDGVPLPKRHGALVRSDADIEVTAGDGAAELLVLQGRPIGAPVAAHGPFVMNSRAELVAAFEDYQRTGFGGWPWSDGAPAHPRDRGRFARLTDGSVVEPGE